MADDAKTLDIVIRTTAELEGARAVEAQLERDIAQAHILANEYGGLETKLKDVRATMAGTEAGTGQPKENIEDGEAAPPNSPVRPDDATTRPGRGREAPADNPWADDNAPTAGVLSRGHPVPVEAPADGHGSEPAEGAGNGGGPPVIEPEPAIGEMPGRGYQFEHGPKLPPPVAPAPIPQIEDTSETEADIRMQGAQAAGERMRAALERNGQATVSLLNRTLELIEQQNQRLGDAERRIAELAGRIKSLRNP